ncbi:ribosomal protein S18-alanine N-acetyltransferase [Aliivibrio fischeri]|uniref:[Ribosomal protein bS18]-alanine N-acetyltransferase n=3 Tax=Aliivibrio fischeri TaxID=668 RepID=Q5E7K2_ALIF1|nr:MULTISPECIES: ribosomal protein S18-alanine N-acetyltransferase [Aliivibrio]AAW84994.1 acetylase for 30S ribosomal subunit protein S18 [Aliivibrio fischeri ES114]ACH66683.1 ribosomal-protein-alanine acetyltransferase [Aliivibrio fischeri MJ11]KLU77844.1 alanine acetyltransferase [Aliivibrio fischeri]MBD1569128.1 ribosomal protein S18-alanine N-acetyltransferase [Aliivibrio sp. S10_S31]MBP3141044.1 ribosomal protein S18-alanine N-acetyltransferase [Aliivibrio fischeri]
MTIKIQTTSESHLDDIWRIERAAHSHPWAESMIRELDSRCAQHRVMLVDEQVVGYFYAQNVVGEVTLLNIAIDPAHQGKGFGRKLTEFFIDMCMEQKAESAWLEVRESNTKAISLYESEGFNEVTRRHDYYPTNNGKEDAIIMSFIFF